MSSNDRPYYLNVDLHFGEKSIAFSIPPVLIVLLLLFGAASYKVADINDLYQSQQQEKLISELQAEKLQLEESLAHKEKERNQMAALAEARSQELWRELETRDRELNRLWRVVGEKPEQATARGTKPRKALLSARAGQRRSALAVKVDYSQLGSQVETRSKEIEKLAAAAKQYQQKKG